jgi:transcriptional regulator
MYRPTAFDELQPERLHELIHEHPLGLLVRGGDTSPHADLLPWLVEPGPTPAGTLVGHVARANPLWREAAGREVLVVFQGPQAYISPGWDPSKADHGKVVPTWNYAMVQARGTLRAIDDAEWLREFVTRLTTTHEATQSRPWAVSDAPPAFVDTMLRAIVGIEIELTALVGKWKVSQNRSAADRRGVADGLSAGDPASAALVPR